MSSMGTSSSSDDSVAAQDRKTPQRVALDARESLDAIRLALAAPTDEATQLAVIRTIIRRHAPKAILHSPASVRVLLESVKEAR